MSEPDNERLVRTLEEIRDLLQQQIAAAQKAQERAERIQDRAEQIQARSAQIVNRSRRILAILLPVVIALIVYVSWLLFRYTR